MAPLFIKLNLITENKIRELVAEKIENTDYYILSVDVKPGNSIYVEIESMGPVSIEDCVSISRQIEHNLNRDEEDFSLQVASPGLDKPLRDYRQFIKNIGRDLNLRLSDNKEMKGELIHADEDKIQVKEIKKEKVEGKKKKVMVEHVHTISYPEIKQAKIRITFK